MVLPGLVRSLPPSLAVVWGLHLWRPQSSSRGSLDGQAAVVRALRGSFQTLLPLWLLEVTCLPTHLKPAVFALLGAAQVESLGVTEYQGETPGLGGSTSVGSSSPRQWCLSDVAPLRV